MERTFGGHFLPTSCGYTLTSISGVQKGSCLIAETPIGKRAIAPMVTVSFADVLCNQRYHHFDQVYQLFWPLLLVRSLDLAKDDVEG